MLFLISVAFLVITFMGLRLYVEKKMPELKGREWNLDDLKNDQSLYRNVRNMVIFLLLFVGLMLIISVASRIL